MVLKILKWYDYWNLLIILLRKCEIIFKKCIDLVKLSHSPEKIVLSEIQYDENEFPNCHSLDQQILKRFIRLRLNIYA